MTTQHFSGAIDSIVDTYNSLHENDDARHGVEMALQGSLTAALRVVSESLKGNPIQIEQMSDDAVVKYSELRVIQLLFTLEPELDTAFTLIEDEVRRVIAVDSAKARKAGGTLVACLLLAIEDLPAVTDRLLVFLGSLTGRREGIAVQQHQTHCQLLPETLLGLSKLLDYALFGEVFAFLTGIPHLQRASVLPELGDLNASVVSIASRKGGVGKSTLAFAIALALLRKGNATRLCVIDLDITGPIWQYLLSPDGKTAEGRPLSYLNQLVNIEQPDSVFDFGCPPADAVLECVAPVRIPLTDRELGLLTFADLPRTNRYLVQAIANNRESFTEFFVAILRALSQRYDFIVIDNTPGFDPHPLITLVIAGAVSNGLPIMISTPNPPDLRGTFLELSDLRLLKFKTAPLWIINKADEKAEKFFSEARTLVEIAEMTRGYAEIMPDAPLLQAVLKPRPPARIAQTLPFDPNLARPNLVDFAEPLDETAITSFMSSRLFRQFEQSIDGLLPPHSAKGRSQR